MKECYYFEGKKNDINIKHNRNFWLIIFRILYL